VFAEVDLELQALREIGMQRKIQVLPTMEAWRGGECLDSVGSGEPAKVLELLDRHFDESKQEAEGAEGGGSAQLAKAAIAAGALCALGFLVRRQQRQRYLSET
jgi:thioredoxin-like negative regulator of GroEL